MQRNAGVVPLSKQGGLITASLGPDFPEPRMSTVGWERLISQGIPCNHPTQHIAHPRPPPLPTDLSLPKISTVGPLTRDQFSQLMLCFLLFQVGKGGAVSPAPRPAHTPASLRQLSSEPPASLKQLLSFPVSLAVLGFSSCPRHSGIRLRTPGSRGPWPEWWGLLPLSRKPGPQKAGGSRRDSRAGGPSDDLPIVSGRDSSS